MAASEDPPSEPRPDASAEDFPVSIAIACHNAAAYVGDAVRSALAQRPAPLEVVVCDDGSTDGSREALAAFGDAIRIVRHERNRGEAAAKNTAVAATRSPWVALLDADDEFLPGRLAAVEDLLAEDPGLDIVTTDAVLVHGDSEVGRWYGDGYPFAWEDQRRAVLERNFVFGNVVVRRDAFLAAGGFDTAIAHATDWDLWIRMIHAGSRVGCVLRPLARYRLHEASLSSDRAAMNASIAVLLRAEAERLELTAEEAETARRTADEHERRAARFRLKQSLVRPDQPVRRHAAVVVLDPRQPQRSRVLAAVTYGMPRAARWAGRRRADISWEGPGDVRLPRRHRRRILVVLPDRPWPMDGGKRTRSGTTLKALAGIPHVELDVLVLFAGPPVAQPLPPGVVARSCLQVDGGTRRRLVAVTAFCTRWVPWHLAVRRWGLARKAVRQLQRGTYDLVWFGATEHAVSLSRSVAARRTVVDMDDVEPPKLGRSLALPPDSGNTRGRIRLQRRLELPLWGRLERRVLREADAVVVCSELDRLRLGPGPVRVVPNTYVPPASRGTWSPPTGARLVMVGTYYYAPNVDAADHMARRIMPHLLRYSPSSTLRLVGRGGRELLADLEALPGVELVGDVEDVGPELLAASAAVVPVRFGGGTRVKILEAFAFGVPVISTSLGCEGLDAVDGVHLMVADDEMDFAAACVKIIDEPEEARRLGENGRRLYETRYTQRRAVNALRDVVEPLLDDGGSAAHRFRGSRAALSSTRISRGRRSLP